MQNLGQFPAQIHRVLHTQVESLSTSRGMHVCCIAGEEDASVPVRCCLARHISKPGDVSRAAQTIVRSVKRKERLTNITERRLALLDLLFIQYHSRMLVAFEFGDSAHALSASANAPFRHIGGLHF